MLTVKSLNKTANFEQLSRVCVKLEGKREVATEVARRGLTMAAQLNHVTASTSNAYIDDFITL